MYFPYLEKCIQYTRTNSEFTVQHMIFRSKINSLRIRYQKILVVNVKISISESGM